MAEEIVELTKRKPNGKIGNIQALQLAGNNCGFNKQNRYEISFIQQMQFKNVKNITFMENKMLFLAGLKAQNCLPSTGF